MSENERETFCRGARTLPFKNIIAQLIRLGEGNFCTLLATLPDILDLVRKANALIDRND